MSRERSNLGFGEALDDLDLSEFTPTLTSARLSKTVTAKAAKAAGFMSREPRHPETRAETDGKDMAGQGLPVGKTADESPPQRRRRTGRNAQFNLKARPDTIDAYCALADRMGWGLGETLERAVHLLEREYGKAG